MARVYRVADRLAARHDSVPVARGACVDRAAAVRELGAVVAWCDALVTPPPLRWHRKTG